MVSAADPGTPSSPSLSRRVVRNADAAAWASMLAGLLVAGLAVFCCVSGAWRSL